MPMPRFALFFLWLAILIPNAAGAAILAGWSQYGAGGVIEARIVTDDPACPALIADGASLPMAERSSPGEAFPVRVCVASLPKGTRTASAAGRTLPVPIARPRHIVLLGDTGCRLKDKLIQACNDENAWPFRKIAEHAAGEHPDLVIHVGDYLYRETPCPPDDARCAGTPTGDNWPTWQADFFSPGASLLGAAVWLAERGNHEDCHRAGIGWTALLGRAPITLPCIRREKPLLVDLGGVRLALLDDNDAADKEGAIPEVAEALRQDLAAMLAGKPNWIVTHHPFRGVSHLLSKDGVAKLQGANDTLLAALQGVDESSLSLLLAGHIHNFQIENFLPPLAPQMVVGEGGDRLDPDVPPQLTGLVSGGAKITDGLSLPGFGYVVIDRIGESQDWTIAVHDADGKILRHCSLKARKLACEKS